MGQDPLNSEAAEEGYFANRIRNYLKKNHPDLLENKDSEQMVRIITQNSIGLFQSYDQTGMPLFEALELALVETLESITSPFGVLREFMDEHLTLLEYLTGQKTPDAEVMYVLLPQNRVQVLELVAATTEKEVKVARRNLHLGIRETLRNFQDPQS